MRSSLCAFSLVVLAAPACSGDPGAEADGDGVVDTAPGSGGSSETGGAGAAGKAQGTGGAKPTGSGGSASTGGAKGTGGTQGTGGVQGTGGGGGVSVIFDTDMGPDIDDAGALAVLHALADNGEARLLAVVISTTNDTGTPAIGFVDQVDTYYGRPDIPIGVWKGGSFRGPDANNYTRVVYDDPRFPRSLDDRKDSVPDATSLYRTIMAAESDASVTVVCTGFLQNLKALLTSGPDAASTLSGTELVAKKVKQLVVMGGQYPSGNEYNFYTQPLAGTTKAVVDGWPTPIVFSGFEIGDPIHTGSTLPSTPDTNPVRRAYAAYFGNEGSSRPSWDPTAALFAVRGASTYWDLVTVGYNQVEEDGRNAWKVTPDRDQSYLVKKADNAVMQQVLDGLMTKAPGTAK